MDFVDFIDVSARSLSISLAVFFLYHILSSTDWSFLFIYETNRVSGCLLQNDTPSWALLVNTV